MMLREGSNRIALRENVSVILGCNLGIFQRKEGIRRDNYTIVMPTYILCLTKHAKQCDIVSDEGLERGGIKRRAFAK